MDLTGIGYVLLPATLCLAFWPRLLMQLVLVATVFGAAAPIVMSGSADALALPSPFLPGLMLIGVLALQTLIGLRPATTPDVAWMVLPFLLFVLLAVVGAYFLPRFFLGEFQVWPQRLGDDFTTPVYLEPSAGNMTQGVYLITNALMLLFSALFVARSENMERIILRTYLFSGYLVIGICLWEWANKLTGIYFPQDFLYSNPRWAIYNEQTFGDVARINGPFTEPAALAAYLSGIVFTTLNLLLRGHHTFARWLLLGLAIVATALSTSTTGLVVILLVVPLLVLRGVIVGAHGAFRFVAIGLAGAVLLGLVGFFTLPVIAPHFDKGVQAVTNQTLEKSESASYEDRTTKDLDSIALLLPSDGLGAGWGSVRSSSLIPGILGNTGVPGMLLLIWFAVRISRRLAAARRAAAPDTEMVVGALTWSLLGNLCAAVLAAPTIDAIDFFLRLGVIVGCCARLQPASAAAAALREAANTTTGRRPPLRPAIAGIATGGARPSPTTGMS